MNFISKYAYIIFLTLLAISIITNLVSENTILEDTISVIVLLIAAIVLLIKRNVDKKGK